MNVSLRNAGRRCVENTPTPPTLETPYARVESGNTPPSSAGAATVASAHRQTRVAYGTSRLRDRIQTARDRPAIYEGYRPAYPAPPAYIGRPEYSYTYAEELPPRPPPQRRTTALRIVHSTQPTAGRDTVTDTCCDKGGSASRPLSRFGSCVFISLQAQRLPTFYIHALAQGPIPMVFTRLGSRDRQLSLFDFMMQQLWRSIRPY
jgi:hypothetical protein